jgi:6-phosphogluconate dehydrogenase
MQIAMVGLGRMGASMTQRLLHAGHQCVVHDQNTEAMSALEQDGATITASLEELVKNLQTPRAIWLMLPVAIVDKVLDELSPLLQPGDIIIDGGNSFYHDDIRRAADLQQQGIHYLDVGVSGGIWGQTRGYCLMIGGEEDTALHMQPVFASLAPGVAAASRTPGRETSDMPADQGFLHCGQHGAGHFVKMVHNGIEYGFMAALAEGLNILHGANAGEQTHDTDAETTPLHHPEYYPYNFDLKEITELWRRGSVIGSWLLDLSASALLQDPGLDNFAGRVSDSGEGRWTVQAAIDEGIPAPVISAAVFSRFNSRDNDVFANKVLSAMRYDFGGHNEKTGGKKS